MVRIASCLRKMGPSFVGVVEIVKLFLKKTVLLSRNSLFFVTAYFSKLFLSPTISRNSFFLQLFLKLFFETFLKSPYISDFFFKLFISNTISEHWFFPKTPFSHYFSDLPPSQTVSYKSLFLALFLNTPWFLPIPYFSNLPISPNSQIFSCLSNTLFLKTFLFLFKMS